MEINLESEDGIEKDHPILVDIQGNILKGHGRDHARHVFLRFDKGSAAGKELIQNLSKFVTSAAGQIKQKEDKESRGDGGLFVNFFLSRKGYEALAFGTEQIPYARGFSNMEARGKRLEDDPTLWEPLYKESIHAMVLLAHEDEDKLPPDKGKVPSWFKKQPFEIDLKKHAEILGMEKGNAIKKNGNHVEHFGFVDGISQPLFFKSDIQKDNVKNPKWPSRARPGLVLAKDSAVQNKKAYGSFLVYRKLKQDVKGFNLKIDELSKVLIPQDKDRAGALVIGRFKDGTPIQEKKAKAGEAPPPNDFNYDGNEENFSSGRNDPSKCPFHSHIRKTNPRGSHPLGYTQERERRIARRGIPFGKDSENEPVGLLFLCFQSDIEKQFEYMQRTWCNDDPDETFDARGLDPLVSQGKPREKNGEQVWPVKWGIQKQVRQDFPFSGFVELAGGEYFFAPSIGFLKNIGKDKEDKQKDVETRKPGDLHIEVTRSEIPAQQATKSR